MLHLCNTNSTCGICMGSNSKLYCLNWTCKKCNNSFHNSCINQWADTSQTITKIYNCPLCREIYKVPKKYHELKITIWLYQITDCIIKLTIGIIVFYVTITIILLILIFMLYLFSIYRKIINYYNYFNNFIQHVLN